jgi:hypothetical protein
LGVSVSRRAFLKVSAGALAMAAVGGLPTEVDADAPAPMRVPIPQASPQSATLQAARVRLLQIAQSNVVNRTTWQPISPNAAGDYPADDQLWIRPSDYYRDFFSRDSFWTVAALQNKSLLEAVRARFHGDQRNQADGHVATALRNDLTAPPDRDRDDESTLLDVLREYEYARLGGTPDLASLGRSYDYIRAHIQNGHYVTRGALGGYHYWADTFRAPNPQAFAYNQGLLCAALEALNRMGIPVGDEPRSTAQQAYTSMINGADNASLPQRIGGTTLDVSALAGDALCLYYFNGSPLPDARVKATFDRLLARGAVYSGGKFVGFRVLCGFDGSYLGLSEFNGTESVPGNYQNGGSWLLYDALALYSAARHGVPRAADLLLERITTEFERRGTFFEFARTSPSIDYVRTDYGWNSFAANLIA